MVTMRRVPGSASGPLNKMLQDLKNARVSVGWFESSKYPDANSTPVAYVAAINELGPNARPFMSTTAADREDEWAELMFNVSKRIAKGTWTVEQGLEAVGMQVGGDIQKKIAEISAGGGLSLITLIARAYRRDGKSVTGATIGQIAALVKKDPAAAATAAEGEADTPLNDSGYMRATIAVAVNNNTPVFVDGGE